MVFALHEALCHVLSNLPSPPACFVRQLQFRPPFAAHLRAEQPKTSCILVSLIAGSRPPKKFFRRRLGQLGDTAAVQTLRIPAVYDPTPISLTMRMTLPRRKGAFKAHWDRLFQCESPPNHAVRRIVKRSAGCYGTFPNLAGSVVE